MDFIGAQANKFRLKFKLKKKKHKTSKTSLVADKCNQKNQHV